MRTCDDGVKFRTKLATPLRPLEYSTNEGGGADPGHGCVEVEGCGWREMVCVGALDDEACEYLADEWCGRAGSDALGALSGAALVAANQGPGADDGLSISP